MFHDDNKTMSSCVICKRMFDTVVTEQPLSKRKMMSDVGAWPCCRLLIPFFIQSKVTFLNISL